MNNGIKFDGEKITISEDNGNMIDSTNVTKDIATLENLIETLKNKKTYIIKSQKINKIKRLLDISTILIGILCILSILLESILGVSILLLTNIILGTIKVKYENKNIKYISDKNKKDTEKELDQISSLTKLYRHDLAIAKSMSEFEILKENHNNLDKYSYNWDKFKAFPATYTYYPKENRNFFVRSLQKNKRN